MNKKRILSLLLAIVMVISLVPTYVFATEGQPTDSTVTEPVVTDPVAPLALECEICGAADCTSTHENWCEICKKDDCGQTHTPGNAENPSEPSQPTENQQEPAEPEGPKVGDKIWIKSGSKVYKKIDGKSQNNEHTVIGNYQVEIKSVVTDENGKLWYEYSTDLYSLLIASWKYVEAENTTVEKPEDTAPDDFAPSEEVADAIEELKAAETRNEFEEIFNGLSDEVKGQFTEKQLEELEEIKNSLNSSFDKEVEYNGIEIAVNVLGDIPVNANVTATPVTGEELMDVGFSFDEHEHMLTAIDVTIYDENGQEWQPEPGKPITITFDMSGYGLEDGDTITVHHKHADEEPIVSEHEIEEGYVNYETDKLSVMAVAAGGYAMYPEMWKSNKSVYWDVAEKIGSGFPSHQKYSGTATRVKSVYFNGNSSSGKVARGDSNKTSGWSISGETPKALSSYYSGTTYGSEADTRELTIIPGDGYYVRQVIVACTARMYNGIPLIYRPYNCGTWESGNEYNETLDYEKSGAVTIDIPSIAFCHLSNNGAYTSNGAVGNTAYFILIDVAPLPDPLRVEYKYGTIINNVAAADKAIFNTSSRWLNPDNRNAGNHTITRQNDRFTYTASGSTDDAKAAEAAKWRHYANTISPEAEAAAAAAGYVFDGWEVKYYSSCNTSFTFSGQIGSAKSFVQKEQVPLMNHVQLIAKWKKAPTQTLTIQKTVKNDTDPNATFTFKMTLSNPALTSVNYTGSSSGTLNAQNGEFTFTLKGGQNIKFTLPKGITYRVWEVSNDNYTTTSKGTTNGTLNSIVDITFTNTRKTQNVSVKKIVDGETKATDFAFEAKLWADSSKERQIPFPTNIGTNISRSSDGLTATFTLDHEGMVTFLNLPVGAVLEVTEKDTKEADSTENDTYPPNDGKTATYVITDTPRKVITFTNKYEVKTSSVTVKKVVLDPYTAYPDREFTFTITMQDGTTFPNGDEKITFTLIDGGWETIKEIPIGKTLIIMESGNDGFTTTNTHGEGVKATVTVTAEEQEVIYTNTAITSLTITKNVEGEADKVSGASYPVELKINGEPYNGAAILNDNDTTITDGKIPLMDEDKYVIVGLPVGTTYSVTEAIADVEAPDGFEFKAPVYEISTTQDSETTQRSEAAPENEPLTGDTTVTITNELIAVYGHLRISKTDIQSVDHHGEQDSFRKEEKQSTVYKVEGIDTDNSDFYMEVVLVGNSSVLIKNIPVGRYRVTEIESWSWRYDSEESEKGATVVGGETEETKFSNTRKRIYWLSGDNHVWNLFDEVE